MPALIDLTGRRFGRLTVLHRAPTVNKRTLWRCRCDCGEERDVQSYNLKHPLKRYRTVSCGCYQREVAASVNRTHGASRTPEMKMYWQAKKRAKRTGISFTIAPSDVVIPDDCPLLAIPLEVGSGVQSAKSPSLDRVDPSRGYDPGNVWVISYRANTLKSDATVAELRRLVAALEARCAT